MKKIRNQIIAFLAALGLVINTVPEAVGPNSVTASAATNDNFRESITDGESSDTGFAHDYINVGRWSTTVKSYLEETENGYCRVEAIENSREVDISIVVEEYSKDYTLLSQKHIEYELPIFGGYFLGESYRFLVFGQENEGEDDSAEVLRIVKYDKSWNRLEAKSISDMNTTVPFDAGSLRMAEGDGKLFIHTCHEMYKTSDGYNHQANMTFVLDQDTMDVTQSWYNVMNIDYGYVSHSFNQFVQTDGTYLYRVDHGDAYPRAVVLTKASIDNITFCSNKDILPICGDIGANDTGVAVGGFEMAGGQLVVVGNSVSQDEASYRASGARNVFVTSTDTDLESTKITWLTNYTEAEEMDVRNPHLVKVSEEELYVLWEEWDLHTGVWLKVAQINKIGELQGRVYTLKARLSDCAPIFTSDGEIVWYVTFMNPPELFHIAIDRLADYDDTESSGSGMGGTTGGDTSGSGTGSTTGGDTSGSGTGSTTGGDTSGNGTGSTTGGDKSNTSNNDSNTTDSKVQKPGKVTGVQVRVGKKKLTVSWTKKSGVSGYQLQYALNKKFTKKKKSKLAAKTKVVIKKRKKKKTYYFRVRAYKLNGKKAVYGKWSKVKKVSVT